MIYLVLSIFWFLGIIWYVNRQLMEMRANSSESTYAAKDISCGPVEQHVARDTPHTVWTSSEPLPKLVVLQSMRTKVISSVWASSKFMNRERLLLEYEALDSPTQPAAQDIKAHFARRRPHDDNDLASFSPPENLWNKSIH